MNRQLRRFACCRPLAICSRHLVRPRLWAAFRRSRRHSAFGPIPKFNVRIRGFDAGPRAVRRWGSECWPFAALRVPCGARPCGPVAQLATFAALTALAQVRRVRSRSALCARPQDLRSSAAHSRPSAAPPSGLDAVGVGDASKTNQMSRKAAGGAWAGRIGAAEKRRVAGRARSAPREHACGRLFERSERSERSEFGHGPATRASQGTRSAAKGKPSEPGPGRARRLACAEPRMRKRTPVNIGNGPRADSRTDASGASSVARGVQRNGPLRWI